MAHVETRQKFKELIVAKEDGVSPRDVSHSPVIEVGGERDTSITKGWKSAIETNWSYMLDLYIDNRYRWMHTPSLQFIVGSYRGQNGWQYIDTADGWQEESRINKGLLQKAKRWLKSHRRGEQRKNRQRLVPCSLRLGLSVKRLMTPVLFTVAVLLDFSDGKWRPSLRLPSWR